MTGTGTDVDPYIISDVTDLQAMENDLTAYYELGGNIDASATSGWNSGAGFLPIGDGGDFTGHLDGKGYTISDLTINRSTYTNAGLFKKINSSGAYAIKDLTVGGTVTGRSSIGGLFGRIAGGIIDNCHCSINISTENHSSGCFCGYDASATIIKNCSATGTVTNRTGPGGGSLGGFIGAAYGTIQDCFATGTVTCYAGTEDNCGGFIGSLNNGGVIKRCYSTGDVVNGDNDIGGFAGDNWGTIENCYATGDVAGDDDVGGFIGDNGYSTNIGVVTNCYSTGTPTGNTDVGGFIGKDTLSTVTGCFWDTETSGTSTSDGGIGKTTLEMKHRPTFTEAGWDFTAIWSITPGVNNGYPALGQITTIGRRHFWIGEDGALHWFAPWGVEAKVKGVAVSSDGGVIGAISEAMNYMDIPLDGGTL